MKIGLTYDLRDEYLAAGYSEEETAEFDRADTIDAIEDALQKLGHRTVRIGHAKQLIHRLAAGDTWDLVFNICEGMYGLAREAQVPAILDLYNIPYTFSDPLVMSLSLHKGLTKTVLREQGIPTPRSQTVDRLSQVEETSLKFPLFIKPVAEGTGKGVTAKSLIHSPEELLQGCRSMLETYRQPVLVEEFLPGREFTVGLTGTGAAAEVLGTLEIILLDSAEPDVYSYVNKERSEELVEYRLVTTVVDEQVRDAEQIAVDAWRELGCRDAGRIDLRCDAAGRPQFLEVNPLAGLHPAHSDLPMLCTALGISYLELIRRIIASASQRVARDRS